MRRILFEAKAICLWPSKVMSQNTLRKCTDKLPGQYICFLIMIYVKCFEERKYRNGKSDEINELI